MNVDPRTNAMLVELVKPVQSQYDFNGFSNFVVNASELSNMELFDELYQCTSQFDRESSIERAKIEHTRFFKRMPED